MSIRIAHIFTDYLHNITTPNELARQLRRADDFIRLGTIAGHETLSSLEDKNIVNRSCGLILGSAFGPMETNFDVLDQVVSDTPASPILFSHSVFNATAGYMATTFGIKGCVLTITDFASPFFRALEQGCLMINSGRLDRCLILQVETYSRLLQDARSTHSPESAPWPEGVVCWLLEKTDAPTDDCWCIESLDIKAFYQDNAEYLPFTENLQINEHQYQTLDPLGSSFALSTFMEQPQSPATLTCSVTAPYGSVRLHLRK